MINVELKIKIISLTTLILVEFYHKGREGYLFVETFFHHNLILLIYLVFMIFMFFYMDLIYVFLPVK